MTVHANFWIANIVLSVVSAIVLSALLLVYVKNFRSIKSRFSIGLMAFGALLLVQSVLAVGLYMHILSQAVGTPRYGLDMAMPMFAITAAQLVGFGVLFRISWE